MKLLFICHGHFDNGLELFSKLVKKCETTLIVQVEGGKVTQSVLNVSLEDLPLGLSTENLGSKEIVKQIITLFDIPLNKINILKYNSLSLRDFKNLKISYLFAKWVKRQGFTHIIYYGSSLTWIQHLIFLRGIKRIYTIHDYLPHSGEVKKGKGFQYNFYMKVITKIRTNKFLLLSKKLMNEFVDYYRVNSSKCRYILFGPFNCYKKFSIRKIEEEPYTLLYFGRISYYKGIEYLVEATKSLKTKFPYLKTIIAGNGDFYFDISDIKSDPHFEIYNYHIENEFLVELIGRASVIICPYRDATQSGVVMTAYAFNKPVIATNVGAFNEYVIENRTGLLVKPENTAELANAVEKMLLNRIDINELQNIIEQKFNWDNAVDKILSFCKTI